MALVSRDWGFHSVLSDARVSLIVRDRCVDVDHLIQRIVDWHVCDLHAVSYGCVFAAPGWIVMTKPSEMAATIIKYHAGAVRLPVVVISQVANIGAVPPKIESVRL